MRSLSLARWGGLAGCVCVAAALSAHVAAMHRAATLSAARQTQDLGVIQALDLYDLGDPAVIKMVATPRQVGSIQVALARDGRAWIRANGKSEESRRRLVATTFALEAVRHAVDNVEGREFDQLLRWATDEWRSEAKPSPQELLWHKAALALMEGVMAFARVSEELNSARQRFPAEPRWALVKAWLAEVGAGTSWVPPLEGVAEIPSSVIRTYEAALPIESVRAEAHVRLAYLLTRKNDTAAAMDHAAQAAQQTTEAEIRSLAHLIRGWALTRTGRSADALAAFHEAHDALPAAQSATLWLSHALFVSGGRHEAEVLVQDTLRTGLGEFDPWRLYPRGDFRLWPRLIVQLREAMR